MPEMFLGTVIPIIHRGYPHGFGNGVTQEYTEIVLTLVHFLNHLLSKGKRHVQQIVNVASLLS
jgi:hypothetical protein